MKHQVYMSYAAVMTVQEGLNLIATSQASNDYVSVYMINGVVMKRAKKRFTILQNSNLSCYKCGIVATHFTVERHRNNGDRWPYNLNVYSDETMLTWDHIVPKALDGSDNAFNGRCACSDCNESRGAEMTFEEMIWAATQNPLLVYKPYQKTKATARDVVGLVRKENAELLWEKV